MGDLIDRVPAVKTGGSVAADTDQCGGSVAADTDQSGSPAAEAIDDLGATAWGDVVISPMIAADLNRVLAIEQASFGDPWSRAGFEDCLEQPYAVMLVARRQDRVIGYCCLYHMLDEGEIINVAIAPEARGQGVGLQMLEALLAAGKARGITRFLLDVRLSNTAAQRLYEKAGFMVLARQKNFYQSPTEDAWLMELNVSDTGR